MISNVHLKQFVSWQDWLDGMAVNAFLEKGD